MRMLKIAQALGPDRKEEPQVSRRAPKFSEVLPQERFARGDSQAILKLILRIA